MRLCLVCYGPPNRSVYRCGEQGKKKVWDLHVLDHSSATPWISYTSLFGVRNEPSGAVGARTHTCILLQSKVCPMLCWPGHKQERKEYVSHGPLGWSNGA